MTEIARKILDDCKLALTRLKSDPESGDWKLLRVANLALLRAVGHALHKYRWGKGHRPQKNY